MVVGVHWQSCFVSLFSLEKEKENLRRQWKPLPTKTKEKERATLVPSTVKLLHRKK
jgi:hypothetical protein